MVSLIFAGMTARRDGAVSVSNQLWQSGHSVVAVTTTERVA